MKKKLSVAVIVPVYNVRIYLKECLDSILSQTIADLLVIAVDDGSTDESGNVIDEYATRDSRVVAVHKKNGGLSSARNAGLKKLVELSLSPEYVYFLDSDDFIQRDFLELIIQELQKSHADIGVSSVVEFSKSKAVTKRETLNENLLLDQDGFASLYFELQGWKGTSVSYRLLGNKVFRYDLIRDTLFDESFRTAEDQDWLLKHILLRVRKVIIVPKAVFHYRLRKSSLSKKNRILQDFETFSDILPEIDRYSPSAREGIQNRYFETLDGEIKQSFRVKESSKSKDLVKTIKQLPLRKWEFPLSFRMKRKMLLLRMPTSILEMYFSIRYRSDKGRKDSKEREDFFD